jgi:GNAT superfamily N-acetyltransferase
MAIRFLSKSDYPRLRKFFRDVRGINYTEDQFIARFEKNDSHLSMIYEIDENNEIAAFLGVFLDYLIFNEKEIKVAQFLDGVSNPAYRGKGYFKELANSVYIECKKEGCHFIYGFPNDLAYPVWKKMGWKFSGNMQSIQFYIPTLPLSLSKTNYINFSYWIANVIFKDVTIDSVLISKLRMHEVGKYSISRTIENLNSKLRGNKKIIKVDELVLILKFEKSLQVGLVSPISSVSQFRNLLFKLRLICMLTGTLRLDFILSPNDDLLKYFIEIGRYPKSAVPVGFWPILEFDFEAIKFGYIDFDTY